MRLGCLTRAHLGDGQLAHPPRTLQHQGSGPAMGPGAAAYPVLRVGGHRVRACVASRGDYLEVVLDGLEPEPFDAEEVGRFVLAPLSSVS